MDKNIKRSLSIAYIVSSTLFAILSYLVYYSFTLVIDKAGWVSHNNEVLDRSEKVISSLKDMETGQCGFLLSNDSSFQAPYIYGHKAFLTESKKLKELTADNLIQQIRIDTLYKLVEERIVIMKSSALAREKSEDLFLISFRSGKAKMDSIRQLIWRFQHLEEMLLKNREAELDTFISITKVGIMFFLFLLVGFVIVSYLFIKRQLEKDVAYKRHIQSLNSDLNAANQEIQINNEELKTANEEIQAANEEIHSSNEELKAANEELASMNEEMTISNENLQEAQYEIEKLNSELQARMAAIMDNTIDLVCYGNINLKLIYINKAGRKMLGMSDDNNLSEISLLDFHPEQVRETIVNQIFENIGKSGVWHGETLLRKFDGVVIPVSQVIMAHKNNEGEVEYYSTIIHDLTDVKLAEQLLKNSEQKYKLLFENNPQPMWIYDLETLNFIEVNSAAVIKYGYSKEEFLSMNIKDIRPPEEIERIISVVRSSETGYSSTTGWKHLDKSGNVMEVEVLSYGFVMDNKNVRLVLINDVTEKNNAELDLKKVNAELLSQNEQLEKYAYVISHNIRGPVATLMGLTLVFENDLSTSEINKKTIENIKKVVGSIDNVIIDLNKVLSLRNRVNQAKEPIKLDEEMENVILMLDEQIKNTNAKIKYDFGGANSIFSIKSYVHSIFLNLISNSIKYRHPKGIPIIDISTKIINDNLVIKFEDNGLGIDLDKNEGKIFGLYKRFHFHTEGKGLGLHLVKTQVEALDGQVNVKSKPEEGAIFNIYLPFSILDMPI